MCYMLVCLFAYIMFIRVMVMACDISSYITCIEVLFSMVIIIRYTQYY